MKLLRQWVWKDIKVFDYEAPLNQYYKNETKKDSIVMHHMGSGGTVEGDFNYWMSNKQRVATCVGINRDGSIGTLFDSKYWAHAIGVKIKDLEKFGIKKIHKKNSKGRHYVANNEILNQKAVQVELDSWGQLTKKSGKYFTWTGKEISSDKVVEYKQGFKGFNYFEKYTSDQINTLKLLLLHWKQEYGIDIKYKGYEETFGISLNALKGEPGLWTHNSYREDKADLHPQKELIEMLKSL